MKSKTSYIKTKLELARRLSISRPTIDRYLALEGAPVATAKGYDLAAVVAHVNKNAERIETSSAGSPDLKAARIRQINLNCDNVQFDLDVKRGLYFHADTVQTWQLNLATEAKRLLQSKLINELLPKLVGLTVEEMVVPANRFIVDFITALRKPCPKSTE